MFLAVGVAVLAGVWLAAGESISGFVDRFGTVKIESLPVTPIAAANGEQNSYHGGYLLIGEQEIANTGMDLIAFPLRFQPDGNGMLAITTAGKSFVFGPLASQEGTNVGQLIYRFGPEAGDETSFTMERSVLSWPTPLHINFMTGGPMSTWSRTLFYRLRWKKPSGAKLEMVWKFQQHYEDGKGWLPAWTKGGSGGLLGVEIRR